jgi:hypothetical protein
LSSFAAGGGPVFILAVAFAVACSLVPPTKLCHSERSEEPPYLFLSLLVLAVARSPQSTQSPRWLGNLNLIFVAVAVAIVFAF